MERDHRSGGFIALEALLALGASVLSNAAQAAAGSAPSEPRLRKAGELEHRYQRLTEEGRLREAAPLAEEACTILHEELGERSLETSECLHDLGTLELQLGRFGEAEPLLRRALEAREEALGGEHPYVAESLKALAWLHYRRGRYEEAKPLLERALTIAERATPRNDALIAECLNELALMRYKLGDYEEAEVLFERALTIAELAVGSEHTLVSDTLNNFALLYQERGEYQRAEALFERALRSRNVTPGPEHPLFAQSLNNLALLYWEQGDYEAAEPLFERALTILEAALGREHPDVASCLNNLALVHHEQGDLEAAEPLFERALAIRERALGPEHPLIAITLNNLARLYQAQGEYERAEPLYASAIAIGEKTFGVDHLHIAVYMNNLATMYRDRGEVERAEALYERAQAIKEKALGPEHPLTVAGLNNLALARVSLGEYDSAVELHRRALGIQENHIDRTLVFAEEDRRLAYADTQSYLLSGILASHLQVAPDHRPLAELALTVLLRRKGRVLDLMTRSSVAIRRSLPKEHRYLLDDLARTRDRHARLIERGPGVLTKEQFEGVLAELEREQRLLWLELSKRSPIVEVLSKPVTITDVQRGLPHDGALVELVRYLAPARAAGSEAPTHRYAAYLVFPDRFDWVELGPADHIDQRVAGFRRALQLDQPLPTDLYDAIMRPIVERLGRDPRRLFISPDSALNLVPFAALYDGERYLLERYALHYLSAGRDLLRPWDPVPPSDGPVVVVANPTRANLPGTEQEAALLEELFPNAEVLLHDAASEHQLERRIRPRVMHLATHGFFGAPRSERRATENPMLHSGLLLAPGADSTADGRLTAYELSGWDLRGTELVVLSACGSGLGASQAGEGVFGLRRAFAMAGAQTQVMSLWNIPDGTTATLMESYYRKLLAGGGRAEAMQEVQLEMLRDQHHPGDWASFVVVGEWGPLSAEALPEQPPRVEASRGCRAHIGRAEQGDLGSLLLLASMGLLIRRRARRCSDAR